MHGHHAPMARGWKAKGATHDGTARRQGGRRHRCRPRDRPRRGARARPAGGQGRRQRRRRVGARRRRRQGLGRGGRRDHPGPGRRGRRQLRRRRRLGRGRQPGAPGRRRVRPPRRPRQQRRHRARRHAVLDVRGRLRRRGAGAPQGHLRHHPPCRGALARGVQGGTAAPGRHRQHGVLGGAPGQRGPGQLRRGQGRHRRADGDHEPRAVALRGAGQRRGPRGHDPHHGHLAQGRRGARARPAR